MSENDQGAPAPGVQTVKVQRTLAERLRDAATYIKWLLAIALILLGYFAVVWGIGVYHATVASFEKAQTAVSEAINTAKEAVTVSVKSLECPAGQRQGGAMCYDMCPEGWTSDGTHGCYQPCPAGWPGTETLTHCQHKVIASSVGADPKLSIPTACAGGKTSYAGLCYDVPAGWQVTAPGFIGKVCPAGMRDDGTACWVDMNSYGRGAGSDFAGCERSAGKGNCEKWGLLWYPRCKPSYEAAGCCVCTRYPARISKEVRAQVGTLPDACPAGRELKGRLCYPACPQNYERRADNLEFCSSVCPVGFTNIGIGGCQKPSKWADGKGLTEVGVCPAEYPVRKGDLCYRS